MVIVVVVIVSTFQEAHVKRIFLLEASRCFDLRSEDNADESKWNGVQEITGCVEILDLNGDGF